MVNLLSNLQSKIMKVLFNIMTTFSFLGVAIIFAGGAYVFVNKDAIVDNVKGQITDVALGGVTDALPPGTIPGIGGDSTEESTAIPVPTLPF